MFIVIVLGVLLIIGVAYIIHVYKKVKTWDAVYATPEYKAYTETIKAYVKAKGALEATHEWKDKEKAEKVKEEAWVAYRNEAWAAYREAPDRATPGWKTYKEACAPYWKALEAMWEIPEYKGYLEAEKAYDEAWNAMWATPEYRAAIKKWEGKYNGHIL